MKITMEKIKEGNNGVGFKRLKTVSKRRNADEMKALDSTLSKRAA